MDISQLRSGARAFINNNGRDPELSENPQKAIISLQNDRGTSYDMYIQVQNELAAAYHELADIRSLSKYGMKFNELAKYKQKEIRKGISSKNLGSRTKKYRRRITCRSLKKIIAKVLQVFLRHPSGYRIHATILLYGNNSNARNHYYGKAKHARCYRN